MDLLSSSFNVVLVVLGISLVIFVHELGHFIAARLCGVRVVTFSLGFGPRLFGWKRGATWYQVAAIPLGGFCRMAGEEQRFDEDAVPADDELLSKSVEQRFFIYSGGVIMNVLFGLVVFPILFFVGVPFVRPVLGEPLPGSPAWHAGLERGTEVLEVNGNEVFEFSHIITEVALGPSQDTRLLVRGREGELREVALDPESEGGIQSIGVTWGFERDDEGNLALSVAEDSAAWDAGLRSDDRLIEVVGGVPGVDVREQYELAVRDRGPLRLLVATQEGARQVVVTPRASDELAPARVGIQPLANRVHAVRATERGAAVDLRPDDRLVSVEGRPILRPGDVQRAVAAIEGPLDVVARRDGARIELRGPELSREEALAWAADVAVVLDVESTQVLVSEGEAGAAAGMRDGDVVLEVDGTKTNEWQDVSRLIAQARQREGPVVLALERPSAEPGGQPTYLDARVTPTPQPLREYGLSLRVDEYVYRSEGIVDSLRIGALSSWRMLEDTWLTLKALLLRRVSSDALGGIISIGAISYQTAEEGLVSLFFFLCVISMNLAVLNVLPIPVLDGGHLLFLVVEKIKGSPVSTRVLGYSQMVGVVLILSLLVFVTYKDLVRWVLPD